MPLPTTTTSPIIILTLPNVSSLAESTSSSSGSIAVIGGAGGGGVVLLIVVLVIVLVLRRNKGSHKSRANSPNMPIVSDPTHAHQATSRASAQAWMTANLPSDHQYEYAPLPDQGYMQLDETLVASNAYNAPLTTPSLSSVYTAPPPPSTAVLDYEIPSQINSSSSNNNNNSNNNAALYAPLTTGTYETPETSFPGFLRSTKDTAQPQANANFYEQPESSLPAVSPSTKGYNVVTTSPYAAAYSVPETSSSSTTYGTVANASGVRGKAANAQLNVYDKPETSIASAPVYVPLSAASQQPQMLYAIPTELQNTTKLSSVSASASAHATSSPATIDGAYDIPESRDGNAVYAVHPVNQGNLYDLPESSANTYNVLGTRHNFNKPGMSESGYDMLHSPSGAATSSNTYNMLSTTQPPQKQQMSEKGYNMLHAPGASAYDVLSPHTHQPNSNITPGAAAGLNGNGYDKLHANGDSASGASAYHVLSPHPQSNTPLAQSNASGYDMLSLVQGPNSGVHGQKARAPYIPYLNQSSNTDASPFYEQLQAQTAKSGKTVVVGHDYQVQMQQSIYAGKHQVHQAHAHKTTPTLAPVGNDYQMHTRQSGYDNVPHVGETPM